MSERLEFFIPTNPPTVTFQAKLMAVNNGKPYMFDSPELKAIKAKFAGQLARYVPAEKLTGPVRLTVKWLFPIGDSHHRKHGEYRDTKPDTDNLQKALKDAMEKLGFFAVGDQQVASEVVEKFWSTKPGIYVCLEELPGRRS